MDWVKKMPRYLCFWLVIFALLASHCAASARSGYLAGKKQKQLPESQAQVQNQQTPTKSLEKWDGSKDKKLLVVVLTNDFYESFLLPWVKRLHSFGDYNYIIELADPSQRCLSVCSQHALQCTNITANYVTAPLPSLPKQAKLNAVRMQSDDTVLGTLQHVVTVRKSLIVHKCLALGYDVVFADMDVFWHKDVARILQQQAIRDNNDLVGSTHFTNPAMNSGLFYFTSNSKTIAFTKEWFTLTSSHPRISNDQAFLNANLGIHDHAKTTPSSIKLSWALASNQSMSLYEVDGLFGDVYDACKTYTHTNDLLASIHLTNPEGSVTAKETCMKELYAGFFPQMMGCTGTAVVKKNLNCFLIRRYERHKVERKMEVSSINQARRMWNNMNKRIYSSKGFIM